MSNSFRPELLEVLLPLKAASLVTAWKTPVYLLNSEDPPKIFVKLGKIAFAHYSV